MGKAQRLSYMEYTQVGGSALENDIVYSLWKHKVNIYMLRRNIMKNKKYIVYVHIFPNDKKYFGITCKKPNARWEGGKGYDKGHQPVMYNAIQKYGWENVEHKILFTNLTYEEANAKEMELIAQYKTNCRRYGDSYGYNMTDGGDGAKGHFVSEEQRQAMSRRLTGMTKELCPNSVPVICDGVEYPSLGDFIEKNNITEGSVSAWLMGKQAMPKEWYDKGLRYKDRPEYTPRCQEKTWRNVIVYNGEEYYSQAKVAKILGVSPSALCHWLNGSRAMPKNIYDKGLYRKGEEDKVYCAYEKPNDIYYDGRYFSSQVELAKYMGVKKATLWAWLNGKNSIPKEYEQKGLKAYK